MTGIQKVGNPAVMNMKPFLISVVPKRTLLAFLILLLVITSYLAYSNYRWAVYQNNRLSQIESQRDNLQLQISDLNSQIRTKDYTIQSQNEEIELKRTEIRRLQNRVNELEEELGITKTQLQETTNLYEEARPYQERVNRGQNLAQSYNLLSDYEDYTKSTILDYLELDYPTIPANDDELWERGRKIYKWISDNYQYCGDKGLRVGTTFYEFQFYSPDELLMSDNSRCGDCDDFATLFSGMMYASGVPESKVWVVCGTVPSGGHCWNWLSLSDRTYRIDPICSQKQTILNILGLDLGIQSAYYTSNKRNVQCFSEYNEEMKMNPSGFYILGE